MIFISSCSTYHADQSKTATELLIKSLPPFPPPSESVVGELNEVCPHDKCHAIYDWLDRLMKFEKQMALYNER